VRSSGARSGWAAFDIPRLPAREAAGPDAGAIAPALGLAVEDVPTDRFPVERWTAGNAFTFVPIRTLDAMRRIALDLARFDAAFGADGHAAAFLFSTEVADAANTFHARMFAPAFGILEDPATGSAAAAFAGYLAAHGGYQDGEHIVRIEQGYEMGRPSLIELTLVMAGGQLTGASIAGEAVIVLEGTL
jgi:trans-2,3-dihydro-3-hydroxyanthranilate isomerase